MRFIPTSFTILLILSASVVAQPLPTFELTKEWKAKIEAIAPVRPLAEPGKKRLALVFNLITGYHHWCTPHMTEVVRIMGEKSGAYAKAVELRKALEDWKNELPVPNYEGGYHDSLVDFLERQWGFREPVE